MSMKTDICKGLRLSASCPVPLRFGAARQGRTVAIIQARMGSSRLPGKVLMDVAGEPMLARIISRARKAQKVDHVLVATTDEPSDDAIAHFCAASGIDCFRGSSGDVLDRYLRAAQHSRAEVVVRLTADCPLHDGSVIDSVLTAFHSAAFDYVSNVDPPTYPDGLDTEVFTFDALHIAWSKALLPSEREHVTPYLRKSSSGLRTGNVVCAEDLSGLRWTVDEPADLAFARAVYHALETPDFGMADVLALLRRSPHLQQLNARHLRNEGYLHSLQCDRLAA